MPTVQMRKPRPEREVTGPRSLSWQVLEPRRGANFAWEEALGREDGREDLQCDGTGASRPQSALRKLLPQATLHTSAGPDEVPHADPEEEPVHRA